MSINKIVNSTRLDQDLESVANAIRTKGGTSAELEFPSGFVSAVQAIPSGGGTTITDGIVVKTRNANGFVTEVDKYGDCGSYEFGVNSNGFRDFPFGYLETVFLHDCDTLGEHAFHNRFITRVDGLENIISCGISCFMQSGLETISLPSVTSVGSTCFRQVYTTCKNIYLPVLSSMGNYIFQSSTGLEIVQIGSVGHPAPTANNQPFYSCTQSNLTITAYATGADVDTLVANYRRNATAATIIIKASEATTYNGTSYAAGDTILTSEVA